MVRFRLFSSSTTLDLTRVFVGLWDTGLITKAVREQHNYTRPLPSDQIESQLRHTIYDPYIRLILWEGVRVWWRESLNSWFTCPTPSILDQNPSSQLAFTSKLTRDVSMSVCAETWARETHKITCGMVFPKDYDYEAPAKEVNTPEYYGPIRGK